MEYSTEIELSILRIMKNQKEQASSEKFEVVYKSGIYILMNNFEKFEKFKSNNIGYIPVKIVGEIELVVKHLTYRLTKEKLNPIESALLSNELEQIYNVNLKKIAEILGKTEGDLSNKRRLLKLPVYIQSDIINNSLRERHGRAILQLIVKGYEDKVKEVYQEIKFNKLNVSDSEKYINKILGKTQVKENSVDGKLTQIEDKRELSNRLAIPAINQIENDLKGSLELITKHYPHLEVVKEDGIAGKDYIIRLIIKNVK